MNIEELFERGLEVIALALIKVLATRLMGKHRPEQPPGAIICVQVPPEIANGSGGDVEIHWTGKARVPGKTEPPQEVTK